MRGSSGTWGPPVGLDLRLRNLRCRNRRSRRHAGCPEAAPRHRAARAVALGVSPDRAGARGDTPAGRHRRTVRSWPDDLRAACRRSARERRLRRRSPSATPLPPAAPGGAARAASAPRSASTVARRRRARDGASSPPAAARSAPSPWSSSCCWSPAAVWLATAGRRHGDPRPPSTPTRCCGSSSASACVALLWVARRRRRLPDAACRPAPARGQHVARRARRPACSSPPSRARPYEVGRLAAIQRDLIAGVFDDDGQSATVVDKPNPFGGKERVNVLLLGGDGGPGREGVRTDTVIVASIDTHTGDTTLFSLPRNLENLPFPAGQPAGRGLPERLQRPAARARACSTPSTATARRCTPASSARPTTRAPTCSSSASAQALGLHHRLLRAGQPRRASAGWSTRSAASPSTSTTRCRSAASPTLNVLPDDYIAPGPEPAHGRCARARTSPAAGSG